MKRDMDIIRSIVLAVRDAEGPIKSVDGIEAGVFHIHSQLLVESGLVVGKVPTDNIGTPKAAVLYRLSWDGHNFADSVADNSIWNKAKTRMIGPSISWSFDILKDVVTATIKESLGL